MLTGLAAAAALAVSGLLPATAAHAADPLRVEAYVVTTLFGGLQVDIKALDTGTVATLDEVRVTVARSVGPDVVKVNKGTGGVVASLKAGNAVTAPIVITPGSYSEADSSSWVKPDVVWAAETVPTEITVELLDATDAVLLARTIPAPTTGAGGVTLADVMPAAPDFGTASASFQSTELYKGIAVQVRTDNLTDAQEVIVRVDREGAAPVIKTARSSVLALLNTGELAFSTAPIIIQPGTYNEAGSSSWYPAPAVWTSETVPTSVTITVKRAFGPDMLKTMSIAGSIEGVLPAAGAPAVLELPTDVPLDIEIPEGAGEVSVDLGTPAGGVVTTPVALTATTPDGVQLELPEGTTVTSDDPAWDGVLQLPVVKTGVTVPPTSTHTASVAFAIEVGSATAHLVFDKPVKLVLPGQAGKKAGFIQGGTFTAIAATCTSLIPETVDDACSIDDGDDLVIWTSHFTTFVAYSLTATGTTPAAQEIANTGVGDVTPAVLAAAMLLLLGGGLVATGRSRRRSAHGRD